MSIDLVGLMADHDILLTAIGDPIFWSTLLAAPLDGQGVHDVEVSPVGTGQVASCLRVRLGHDSPAAPRSVVVKTASSDPVSRTTSAMLRHGEIEVGWYRDLAAAALVTTPHAWAAALNADGTDFVLVLADIDDALQGDQIIGMAVADVARALDELAALHATSWGEVPPGTEPWLVERGDPAAHAVLLTMLHQGFVERYGARLDPEVMAAAEALIAHAPAYLTDRPGPRALVHGDFRPDNLLVGRDAVTVVDWQTVTVGPAFADVAYFLGGALLPHDRATHEAELLARYRARLAGHGIDVSAADLSSGYRRYALDGLVMAIGASQVVGQTERGDEMFCAMAERAARHALEAGSLDMLG